MKRIYILITFLSILQKVTAQKDSVYSFSYIEKSTKFAWFTLGGDILNLTGGSTDFIQNETLNNISFGNNYIPRLTIGGIHFWGHTDFYVTFPLSFLTIQSRPDVFDRLLIQQGIETGARIYPIKLKPKGIRPFAGISFRTMSYRHEISGEEFSKDTPQYEKIIAPIQFGLTYATDKYLISASSYYQSANEIDYYISPTQTGSTQFNPLSFNISILKYWDTDRHMRTKKGVKQLNIKHDILQKENRLSAWYWGVGPSAGLQLSKSEFLQKNHPFLENDFFGGFMPDITFGRFFHKPDMNIGISYRTLGDRLEGFDTEIGLRRHSLMLEIYKNLFNWLGFVPFAGVTASVENLKTNVNGQEYLKTKPAIGFIFGWDIRVTKTETSLLRTNLRWIPDLHMEIEGDKMMFNHLEFNFIQWVHFIGRRNAYNKYR